MRGESTNLRDRFVFVLDDEPRVRSAIVETLQSLGCHVRSFEDPTRCLACLIEEDPCDLVITDISMPQMDGLRFIRLAKDLRPLLPIIVITGYGDVPTAVTAVKLGALEFVEKPLDEVTFLPLVTNVLQTANPKARFSTQALTPTERRVLCLVAEGKNSKEIAALIGCSLRTVENHRHRVTRKVRAENLVDLLKIGLAMSKARESEPPAN